MSRVHLVSYSFPPDNVPAAHRPFELASTLKESGVDFRVYSRFGVTTDLIQGGSVSPRYSATKPKDVKSRKKFAWVSRKVRFILELDKAIIWGFHTTVRLWFRLILEWATGQGRPIVWATAPLTTNLYVATIAGFFSGSRVHIDIRDAIAGVDGSRIPLLTRLVLSYASSASAVTASVEKMLNAVAPSLNSQLAFNGVSRQAIHAAGIAECHDTDWIKITYSGAIYGGDRPFSPTLELLRSCSDLLPEQFKGIEFVYVGREDASGLLAGFASSRFKITETGEVNKQKALEISAASSINLLLIGDGLHHICGVPLKTFDLLGVGRPILYVGPANADANPFLQKYAQCAQYSHEPQDSDSQSVAAVADWLVENFDNPCSVSEEPSASSQSRLIMKQMGLI